MSGCRKGVLDLKTIVCPGFKKPDFILLSKVKTVLFDFCPFWRPVVQQVSHRNSVLLIPGYTQSVGKRVFDNCIDLRPGNKENYLSAIPLKYLCFWLCSVKYAFLSASGNRKFKFHCIRRQRKNIDHLVLYDPFENLSGNELSSLQQTGKSLYSPLKATGSGFSSTFFTLVESFAPEVFLFIPFFAV